MNSKTRIGKHDVDIKELSKDDPQNRDMITHKLTSLMYDLTMADVLPDDYSDREGLEKLLVSEP